MSEASNYLEDAMYDHVLRNIGFTSPSLIRVALFLDTASSAEIEAGTLTNEIDTDNAYARQAISFAAPSDGSGSNSTAVTFPTATPGDWGTVRFSAIMDAPTNGNVLIYTQLDADVTINAGNTFQFNAGGFVATFA